MPKIPGDVIARFEQAAVEHERWLVAKAQGIRKKKKEDDQIYPYLDSGDRVTLQVKRAEVRAAARILGISLDSVRQICPLLLAQEL